MKQVLEAFHSWLSTRDALEQIGNLLRGELRRIPEDSPLIRCLHRWHGTDSAGLAGELLQEFLLFLMESFIPVVERRPTLLNDLLQGRTDAVLSNALRKFFWTLQDKCRSKGNNPRGYLQRRIRESLSSDSRFSTENVNGFQYYILKSLKPLPADCPCLATGEEYSSWPPPPELGPKQETVFRRQYLTDAAEHFCLLARERHGRNMRIPTRELAAYLAAHFPWLNSALSGPLPDCLPDETSDPEQLAEQLQSRKSIDVLARQFTDGLDDTTQKVFALLLEDPPIKLREIAAMTGLRDHNQVYRIKKKTMNALRIFVMNWPGPSPEDLDVEITLAFVEAVRKICKSKL